MRKKSKNGWQPFQSVWGKDGKEPFTPITLSMRKSVAWHKLTAAQRGLYVEVAAQYRTDKNGKSPEHTPRYDYPDNEKYQNPTVIYFPKSLAIATGAYTNPVKESFKNTSFRRDMKALEALGFIDVIKRAGNIRKNNVYKLSNRWAGISEEEAQKIVQGLSSQSKQKKTSETSKPVTAASDTAKAEGQRIESQSLCKLTQKQMGGFSETDIIAKAKSIAEEAAAQRGIPFEWSNREALLDAVEVLKQERSNKNKTAVQY